MSAETQERVVTSRVITWTQFRVPESEPIFEIRSKYPPTAARQKWVDTISPLTKAAGFEDACWIRYRDAPETVALYAAWKSRQVLQDFKASPEHARYWAGISAFSKPEPEPEEMVMKCDNWNLAFSLPRQPWVSIIRVQFAHPTEDAQRQNVRRLNGLYSPWPAVPAPSACKTWRSALNWVSQPVWALSPQLNGDGVPVETVLLFHSWRSAEEEEEYKQTERQDWDLLRQGSKLLPPVVGFDGKPREFGALAWTEEYPQAIVKIPRHFNG